MYASGGLLVIVCFALLWCHWYVTEHWMDLHVLVSMLFAGVQLAGGFGALVATKSVVPCL